MTVQQVKDVGVHVSLSTVERRLHEDNLRGFTTQCKPPGVPQKQKAKVTVHISIKKTTGLIKYQPLSKSRKQEHVGKQKEQQQTRRWYITNH